MVTLTVGESTSSTPAAPIWRSVAALATVEAEQSAITTME